MFEDLDVFEEEKLNIFEKIVAVFVAVIFFLFLIITMIILLPVLIVCMIVCEISDAVEFHKCKKIVKGNKQYDKRI